MKDKLYNSIPEMIDDIAPELSIEVRDAIIENHDQEMQRVVDEKDKEIIALKADLVLGTDYVKVKQLEQQIKDLEEEVRKGQIQFIRAEDLEKQLKESREVSALKTFKYWYLTLGHMNPEALIQLKETIPEKILSNLINGDKKGE